ncbi:MAG: ATP-binding cassette domain-containing protein, partial [Rhodospirillaceae bacterium]
MPGVRLESLTKRYGLNTALDAVDLVVDEGDVIALIGPSGAGKSTLIRCINRLVEPTGGRVLLGETDLTSLKASALRRA